jgi:ribosomal protein S18 acetylase RimI-like enzyme
VTVRASEPEDLFVRDAGPEDNEALVTLAAACPMEGEIGLCIDRTPDFFALNRLEGESWRVGVVDAPNGRPIGCISVAERQVHVNRQATRAMYVSDLKVHPDHRGQGVADALTEWARDACVAAGGQDVLAFLTILAGNQAMARRMQGRRDLPPVEQVGTIRTRTVSLLWRRRAPRVGVRVTGAGEGDVEEMADLWREVAPGRQFSAVYDGESLPAWIAGAPGLELSSYWLARRADGRLAGFLALWDQFSFKQMRVTSYSRKLAAVRAGFNVLAPMVGATRLPAAGGHLRNLNAVHICVRPEEPEVLRALLLEGYNAARGKGYSFINLGLDVDDPLASALSGLFAQPTDVWFCVASAGGGARAGLDPSPIHHEIALI